MSDLDYMQAIESQQWLADRGLGKYPEEHHLKLYWKMRTDLFNKNKSESNVSK